MSKVFLLAALTAALVGCDSHDSDYYPYAMTALDSWVHDDALLRDYYAGRVEAIYFGRREATQRCRDLAFALAQAERLSSWSYACCTVTPSSECVTKVR